MFSFHVDPDLEILLEKLTSQTDARPGLGTQFVSRLLVIFGSISLKRIGKNRVSEAVHLIMT